MSPASKKPVDWTRIWIRVLRIGGIGSVPALTVLLDRFHVIPPGLGWLILVPVLSALIVSLLVSIYFRPEGRTYRAFDRLTWGSLAAFLITASAFGYLYWRYVVWFPRHDQPQVIGTVYTDAGRLVATKLRDELGREAEPLEVLSHFEFSVAETYEKSSVTSKQVLLFASGLGSAIALALFFTAGVNHWEKHELKEKKRRERAEKKEHAKQAGSDGGSPPTSGETSD